MNNKRDSLDPLKQAAAIRRLKKDLADLGIESMSSSEVDSDMLSLILDKILNGEDLARHYPALYQKLLNNFEMRQALLDVLESIEVERTHSLIPLPKVSKSSLAFLAGRAPLPILEVFDKNNWRSTWRSTLEQIRTVFSPSELVYRTDPSQLEDPWFTLLRDEIETDGVIYTVALECTLSDQTENGLSIFLNLAVTLEALANQPHFPLQATLNWGEYKESVLIAEQGRARFPDIPLVTVTDEENQNIKSGLSLSLGTIS